MQEASIAIPIEAAGAVRSPGVSHKWLAMKFLLVLVVCELSAQIGYAIKIPPHNISPVWPTGAILFSVLVVTPVRHWWLFILAAYVPSLVKDVRGGFPSWAVWYIVAGLGEILLAAVGVRRFAGGVRAFDSTRGLVAYLTIAVFFGPFVSAFVSALAGVTDDYWFYWRAWFFSEALAYLMIAPAILTWIGTVRTGLNSLSLTRCIDACLIVFGLVATSLVVFTRTTAGEASVPALVYLPLPLLLWAAFRFGPVGINTCLLIVAFASIWGTVWGFGPFATSVPAEGVLALQLFLATISVPLMLLATLIKEGHNNTKAFRESQLQLHEQRTELTHLSRVAVLGELTGSLAHELNQPLTAILSNAQAALRFLSAKEPDLSEVREILTEIVEDNNRAGDVIRRLRALFRKDGLVTERLDLAPAIADVEKLVHSDAVLRHVQVRIKIDSTLPAIRGDRIQLQQVLLNLLLNAFEALEHRVEGDRRVDVEAQANGEKIVKVCVRDNGPGLAGDLTEKIFEPFFTTKGTGMGMGLAISRSIVEAHGGALRAENNADRGGTFWFTLPIDESRASG